MTIDIHDSLRGLLDRESFLRVVSRLNGLHDRFERYAVIVIDLDGVERVIDRFGSDSADYLVRLVTTRTQELLPSQGLLGRLNTDTIALIAFDEDEDSVEELCARLQHALRGSIELDDTQVFVSASIGVAFSDIGIRPLKALQHAERAVERVKANGGDATFFYRHHLPFQWRQSA
jgi:diguanylate cyclase (GGDEF)-like protein